MDVLVEVYESVTKKSLGEILMEHLTVRNSEGHTVKGIAFEVVCACLLRQWYSYTVSAFLEEVFGNTDKNLPLWTRNARLIIEEAGTCDELGFFSDSLAMSTMFQTKIPHLLRPDNRMRPDWVSWLVWDSESFWGLSCSTKLLSSGLSGVDTQNDIYSTDPRMFYHKIDGSEINPKAKGIWEDYHSTISDQKIVGNLRLHIVLPETEKSGIIVEENNDVVAFINLRNFSKFCKNPEVVAIVEKLCAKQEIKLNE